MVAIDTDSNPNLGMSLGLSMEQTEAVPVLPRSLLVGPGSDQGGDLIATYGRPTPAGVTLLSAIKVTEAGAGCTCGGHATVRSLLGASLDSQADVTLVDMEAGIEHLSRSGGTLAYVDVLIVVVEPTRKVVVTAKYTRQLAEELGIALTVAIGNKVSGPEDRQLLADLCQQVGIELVGVVPFDEAVVAADRSGSRVATGAAVASRRAVTEVVDRLLGLPDGV